MNESTRHLNPFLERSPHQQSVAQFYRGIGWKLPDSPELASDEQLLLFGRLILEEAFEFLEAAKVQVNALIPYPDQYDGTPSSHQLKFTDLEFSKPEPGGDLVGIADGLGDVSVIATGAMVLNGIADVELLNEIDENNLLKLQNGTKCPKTGKFLKPLNHPKPDIKHVLGLQGWNSDWD